MHTMGETLAHGIANRTLRSGTESALMADHIARAANRPGAMKRAAIYRATRRYLLDAHRHQVIGIWESGKQDGKDKKAKMQLWAWQYAPQEDDPSVRIMRLCFFLLEAKEPWIQEIVFAIMGRHAIARLLQTERTDNLAQAMAQSGPSRWAAILDSVFSCPDARNADLRIGFPLANGVAISAWNERERYFVIKTIVGFSAMNPCVAEDARKRFANNAPYIPWPLPRPQGWQGYWGGEEPA